MGLKKDTGPAPVEPKPDSGVDAAFTRLAAKVAPPTDVKPTHKTRDFDAEAKGKTRCAMYGQALVSPALAGMRWDSMEEFLKLVRTIADDGVAYTFGGNNVQGD